MLVLGGVPVVSAPHETRKSLTPRAVPDIAPLVWAAQFDDSSDKYCTDFKCPEYYDLVEDADTTVCEDRKCTKDVCCEPTGETGYRTLPPTGNISSLGTFSPVVTPPHLDVHSNIQRRLRQVGGRYHLAKCFQCFC